MSVWYETLDQHNKDVAMGQAIEECGALLRTYIDSIREAAGLKKLGSTERLTRYRERMPEEWSAIQSSQSDDFYKRLMKDWNVLETEEAKKPPKMDEGRWNNMRVPHNPYSVDTSPLVSRTSAEITPIPRL